MTTSANKPPKEFSDAIRQITERYIKLLTTYNGDARLRTLRMASKTFEMADKWPVDKTSRWLGYLQCLLIEVCGLTTVETERELTRPIFHEYYIATGHEVPASVDLSKLDNYLS